MNTDIKISREDQKNEVYFSGVNVIRKILRGEFVSEKDISCLVELCVHIGMPIFEKKDRESGYIFSKQAFSKFDENYYRTEVLYMISTLFRRDDGGTYFEIKKCFESLKDESDNSILKFLRGVVKQKITQGLARLAQENNPEEAKVLRNIKNALKKIPGIELRNRVFVFTLEENTNTDSNKSVSAPRLSEWLLKNMPAYLKSCIPEEKPITTKTVLMWIMNYLKECVVDEVAISLRQSDVLRLVLARLSVHNTTDDGISYEYKYYGHVDNGVVMYALKQAMAVVDSYFEKKNKEGENKPRTCRTIQESYRNVYNTASRAW